MNLQRTWPVVLAFALAGCGYAFTYGGGSPQRATVNARVEPLVDLTAEGWPAAVVTDRLRQRLGAPSRDGAWKVSGRVTTVLSGNVPMFRPGTGVTAGVATLKVRGTVGVWDAHGAVLLAPVDLEGSSEMPLADGVSQNEDLRRLALERAARDLADHMADAILAL